jgi:hypothetical protein
MTKNSPTNNSSELTKHEWLRQQVRDEVRKAIRSGKLTKRRIVK